MRKPSKTDILQSVILNIEGEIMSMQVLLSNQPASAVWGEKALISFNEDKATLHLTDFSDRTSIQKAARKLQNQGISDVALSGED